ncbi:conserved hypothetical protein [Sulfolobus islandicus L.S.2.15]|uniref:CRISPR type III-B/RAMP module-associated protein Cmr5 n=1 Tax=Saccharolobus islandicus (strain L.S.2.15 / Lassen \|nr:hypothetical protein [Sulfolobus islandicus]ACP34777.1 conserved hypothetical protein [Sulfolobus islandicus L.S.2.15]
MTQVIKTDTDLLDIATRIAISALTPVQKGREQEPAVDSNTINNLLAYMQSRKSIKELLAYILRQTSRGEIDRNTSKLLLSALKDLKENEEDINKALELLGYVKWIYETLNGLKIDITQLKGVDNFQKLVNELVKRM